MTNTKTSHLNYSWTHHQAQLTAKHLLVLAVLSFQAVHMTLDFKDSICPRRLAGGQEASTLCWRKEDPGLPVVKNMLWL